MLKRDKNIFNRRPPNHTWNSGKYDPVIFGMLLHKEVNFLWWNWNVTWVSLSSVLTRDTASLRAAETWRGSHTHWRVRINKWPHRSHPTAERGGKNHATVTAHSLSTSPGAFPHTAGSEGPGHSMAAKWGPTVERQTLTAGETVQQRASGDSWG